jgi:hypothetical protein
MTSTPPTSQSTAESRKRPSVLRNSPEKEVLKKLLSTQARRVRAYQSKPINEKQGGG